MLPPDPRLLSALSRNIRSECPDCRGSLAVMRVIGGRGGSQYWTQRCVRCGGIHLDIVDANTPAPGHDHRPAA